MLPQFQPHSVKMCTIYMTITNKQCRLYSFNTKISSILSCHKANCYDSCSCAQHKVTKIMSLDSLLHIGFFTKLCLNSFIKFYHQSSLYTTSCFLPNIRIYNTRVIQNINDYKHLVFNFKIIINYFEFTKTCFLSAYEWWVSYCS